MSKNNIHFQTSFSNDSRKIITKEYNLASDDEILLAVWFSDRTYSIFERRGFVVTKNGLAWNFVTMAETAAADGAKERAPRNTNFLEKKKVTFLGADVKSADEAGRTDGKNELQLRISGTLFIFAFESVVSLEKISFLERAISSNFADAFDANSYEKVDSSYSLPLTLLAIKDSFWNIKDICQKKLYDLKLTFRKRKEERSTVKESSRREEESKSSVVKSVNKIGSFFRHIVDLCTDLLLMFALLIFVKPQLLMKNFLSGVTASISGINFSFFYYSSTPEVPQDILDKRNFIFIVLAGLFLILKIFISLSCRKNRKAVTALLFIMLTAVFFLIQEKFIIFLAILLLVLLTMQFSMGFSARVVRVKAVFFVLFSIVFYLVIHITLYDEFAKQVREMLNIMKLPVKWW